MNTIIAGRFDEQVRAETAMAALEATGFRPDQVATFFVNPAGRHDVHGTTLDPGASAAAHHAGAGAIAGAATGTGVGVVVGVATVPVLGPIAALAGAGIGAYIGSLAGALQRTGVPERSGGEPILSEQGRDETPPRKSGMLVAVSATSSSEEASAITVLRAQGAADLERAQGSITRSQWTDFDPLSTPALVTIAG